MAHSLFVNHDSLCLKSGTSTKPIREMQTIMKVAAFIQAPCTTESSTHGPGIERLLAEMEVTSLHLHSCCQSSSSTRLLLNLPLVIGLRKHRLWRKDERKQKPVWSDPSSQGSNPFSLCPQKSRRCGLALSTDMSRGEISGDLSLLSRPGGVKLSRLPHMHVLNYIVLSLSASNLIV